MELKDILELLVKGIVQTEDAVKIQEIIGEPMHGKETRHYKIGVVPEEFSLLVGKGGTTIKALRTIMSKLGGKKKKLIFVDIDETKS